MNVRNWEDFVSVDENGFIVQASTKTDITGIDWSAISAQLGEIEATATTVPGNLDGVEDGDLIAVNLTAGQTYSFDLRGVPGGLDDPYLFLINSAGTTVLQEDDDGGLGRGSMITFTATATGTYYLYATSYTAAAGGSPSVDKGDYTISTWTREADVPGTTNVLASLPTAASLGLGTYYGHIDTSGDNDYFKVEVVAGQYYNFSFAGGAASNAEFSTPGNTAATLTLYNAAGTSLGSNLNFESNVGYFATTNTTIYLRAQGLSGTTGGYTIDVNQVDLATRDPLESLNWDSADNIDTVMVDGVPTAYVYFGAPGENFGEAVVNQGWQPHQIAAVMNALAEYTPITGIRYVQTTDVNQAEFRMITVTTATYGARFYPQDPAYGTQQGIGTFNLGSGGFGAFPQSLEKGGYSYAVILHEFGHAHGVAHPHDNGGGSEIMLGVNGATGSLGVYNLNQGVYTVMSYNDAWQLHPDGPSAFTVAGIDNGWSATLGAFDIAVLQGRYGKHDYNTGDNVYALTDVADDAYYQTIWDTGGNDTIAYGGTFNAQIDLTAATLDYTPTGGGVLSFLYNPRPLGANSTLVRGGFTIANGVVIENATGGSGNDTLIGNTAANALTGNAGNDTLMGRDGNDILDGGAGDDALDGGEGIDTATYASAASAVTVDLSVTAAQATGGAGSDTLSNVENLVGSAFGDVLRGNTNANLLSGGAADDSLYGEDGSDTLHGGAGNDRLDGGAGIDTATYADAASGVSVDLAISAAQATGGAGSDTLVSIENLVGSAFADSLRGNTGDNSLFGGAGNDLLFGGTGNDRLDGGDGIDTATYAGTGSGVTVDLSIVGAQATGGAGSDTLVSIENIVGTNFNDTLKGNGGDNSLIGGLGADTIWGLGGNDQIDGGAGRDLILAGDGADRVVTGDGLDVVTLGAGDDRLVLTVETSKISIKPGTMSIDVVTDFDAVGNDIIDLSGLGRTFTFTETSANKSAGQLSYKTYDSLNGAENALGFDIDGNPGASGVSGPVTVVFGNYDGGSPDFAIVLLNTSSVDADDFILGGSSASAQALGTSNFQSGDFSQSGFAGLGSNQLIF